MDFYKVVVKGFKHKPSISFLGKRSLLRNHNNRHNHNEESKIESVKISQPSVSQGKDYFSFVYRPKFTSEEIDYINLGGPDKIQDWNKIKLKVKKL